MKSMKFQPGSYIEIDDLAGGRRVAMVCKDGVTFWDLLNSTACTPLAVHPIMEPVELGTLVEFSKRNGLETATQALVAHLRAAGDTRVDTNPLFVMRALWFVQKQSTGPGFVPGPSLLVAACEQAEAQEQAAGRIHQLAEQYCLA